MSLVVIPNVSEGRQQRTVQALQASITERGASVLDRHSDAHHHRTVFTVAGGAEQLVEAMAALALAAALAIDLTEHDGHHPRVGALDVCPFVPRAEGSLEEAKTASLEAARQIASQGIPVYLYGRSAAEHRELPELRRGGLEGLIQRAEDGDPPDLGPQSIDPRVGVVCVGAREPLIAFNVWLEGPVAIAMTISSSIRSSNGGLAGVRALGLDMGQGRSQVSMNLIDPATTPIGKAFDEVERLADLHGVSVTSAEIVGLPPERFMPPPDARVARLLMQPGHSLESRLQKL